MKTFTAFRGISPDNSRRRYIDNIFDYQRRRLFNDHTITGDNEFSIPSANVTEMEEETRTGYLVELAAPGFERSDFEVNIDEDILTISGNLGEERQRAPETYYRREYNYTTFNRSWSLPEATDKDNISASYRNGILEVFVPTLKPTERTQQPRRIEISGI